MKNNNNSNKRIRILLVEDDINQIKMMRFILKELKLDLESITTGEEAIEMIAANHYDLVLINVELPGINGIETIRRIRFMESPTKQHTLVSVLTAYPAETHKKKCIESGMDYFIEKPLTQEKLKKVLKKLLRFCCSLIYLDKIVEED